MKDTTFNQETKEKWISIMQLHQDMDRLVQGDWLTGNVGGMKSGCFFGCAMQSSDNALEMAIFEMNLPGWLVYLAEKIFEGLPEGDAIAFPVQLLKSIPVNSDISSLEHTIAIERLTGLINVSNGEKVNLAIKLAIDYHANPSPTARLAARSAARSAAWSAESAESAAESAAWIQERDRLIIGLIGFKL